MVDPAPASAPGRGPGRVLPLFGIDEPWQMSFGERAAFVGLLAALQPALAVEVGTAEGGSLRHIAQHSREVHSFDFAEPLPAVRELTNVTLHTGDSHVLLPEVLAALSAAGRNVDFALVDGDHSAAGVAQDLRDLLDSEAVGRTVIVMHDSMNPEVRRGLQAVDYDRWPKVQHVDLDFLTGYCFAPPLDGELWGGLALVVTDATHPRERGRSAVQDQHRDSHQLFVDALTPQPRRVKRRWR